MEFRDLWFAYSSLEQRRDSAEETLAELGKRQELFNRLWEITPQQRSALWFGCGGDQLKQQHPPRYFDDLSADCQADKAVAEQIELDLHRTSDELTEADIPVLRQILRCYSVHNRAVGYAQGINFVAAVLLSTLHSAERAFWLLAWYVERETCLVIDSASFSYFDMELSGLRLDLGAFPALVATHLPALAAHCGEIGLDCSMFVVDMFVR